MFINVCLNLILIQIKNYIIKGFFLNKIIIKSETFKKLWLKSYE